MPCLGYYTIDVGLYYIHIYMYIDIFMCKKLKARSKHFNADKILKKTQSNVLMYNLHMKRNIQTRTLYASE